MKQFRRQNVQVKSLDRISGAGNTLLDSEKRNEKEMIKKKRLLTRYDQLINYFLENIKKCRHC